MFIEGRYANLTPALQRERNVYSNTQRSNLKPQRGDMWRFELHKFHKDSQGVNAMNLEKSKDRIKELMTRFVTEINVASAMGQTDINRESENVLIQLLSEIYGHTEFEKCKC